jgi:hypothetical protein
MKNHNNIYTFKAQFKETSTHLKQLGNAHHDLNTPKYDAQILCSNTVLKDDAQILRLKPMLKYYA